MNLALYFKIEIYHDISFERPDYFVNVHRYYIISLQILFHLLFKLILVLFSSAICSYFTKRSIICVSINADDESATAARCTECPEVEGVTERYEICDGRVRFSLFFIKNPPEYFSSLLNCINKYGKTFDAVQVRQTLSGQLSTRVVSQIVDG
uniref:Uncharacterized protein n=1 Tax=Romanomermis culicivorax TaxID=13658 RepID=A0A915IV52_ROMCU